MPVNKEVYAQLMKELNEKNVTLIAVSKTKTVEDILALYDLLTSPRGHPILAEELENRFLLVGFV